MDIAKGIGLNYAIIVIGISLGAGIVYGLFGSTTLLWTIPVLLLLPWVGFFGVLLILFLVRVVIPGVRYFIWDVPIKGISELWDNLTYDR